MSNFLFLITGVLGLGADCSPNILVAYHTETNHTYNLGKALAAGAASVEGVEVKFLPIDSVDVEDDALSWAKVLVIGCPVRLRMLRHFPCTSQISFTYNLCNCINQGSLWKSRVGHAGVVR